MSRAAPGARERRGGARWRGPALAAFVLAGSAATARAQDVRLAESPRSDGQRALEAFLARGGYELWTRDTVLARSDTVRTHVLLLEGSARISGRVEGDLYVVDGDLFLRTRGSVSGDVLVLGGGFYDSDLAEVGGRITYLPNERVRVRPTRGDFEVISEVEPRPAFEADGTRGIHTPSYQRVDALTFGIGGLARAMSAPGRPELEGVGRLKTADGGSLEGTVRGSWYLSDRLRLGLGASRATRTNDGWQRPTWTNSLAHFVAGDDNRNYYRSDVFGVELELVSPEPPIWEDAPSWSFSLAAGWEDAESLEARDVTVLFGSDPLDPVPPSTEPTPPYPNPAIDDGSLFFARAGFEWSRRGREGRTAFGIGLEAGFEDDIAVVMAGSGPAREDFDFLLAEGRFSARRATSWGHAWDVFALARVDLAGTLPRQRYATMGGVGTLPTVPIRGLRGPRLAYAEATYAVPILGMAALGGLDVFLRGSAGSVWGEGRDFRLEEAVSGGLAVRLWDFQMELGVSAGSGVGPDAVDVIPFFDIRVTRSARPSQMPRRGRGF